MSPRDSEGPSGGGPRWLRAGLQASTIGLTLVIATIIGFGMGLGLDHLFHTGFDNQWHVGPFTLVFTLLGIAAGFREMIRTVIRLSEEDEQNDP
jgi:F0F1-type ATP synthase assembly protein I